MQTAISELSQIPSKVQKCVDDQTQYQKVASKLISADSLLYIGRGLDYALSMEGRSLKLKENFLYPLGKLWPQES